MPSPEIDKCEANQRAAVAQLRELADLIEAGTIIMTSVEVGYKECNRYHTPSVRTLTMNFIRKE